MRSLHERAFVSKLRGGFFEVNVFIVPQRTYVPKMYFCFFVLIKRLSKLLLTYEYMYNTNGKHDEGQKMLQCVKHLMSFIKKTRNVSYL